MPTDQTLLTLLLGPAGLTVGLVFALWKFSKGDWVARPTLDEMRQQRDRALELLERAIGGNEGIAKAIEERNRLETERIAALRASPSLSQELSATESQIRNPKR